MDNAESMQAPHEIQEGAYPKQKKKSVADQFAGQV